MLTESARGSQRPLATGSAAVVLPLVVPSLVAKVRYVLVALAVTGLGLAIALPAIRTRIESATAVRSLADSYRQEGLLSLPAAARAPMSAALGRDSAAYRVSTTAGGYRAANRAQKLELRFGRSSVSVDSGRGRFALRLRAIGYGARLHAVPAAVPRGAANSVSYTFADALRESYANGPFGLEQSFEVLRAPGRGSGPLTLSMALSGDLRARLANGGVALAGRGIALRYDDLVVRDARGRRLHAWLALGRRRALMIRIDARGALFPLRIDPWVQNGELTTAGASDNGFGYSVAVSGQTIVVGAPDANSGAGAVYVFTSSGDGWSNATQTAVLTPSDPQLNEAFIPQEVGYSVAISGSTIVAGAPYWTQYNNSGDDGEYQGAVYEWTLPSTGVWTNATQTAILSATDLSSAYYLGASVAVEGSTIVAGAPEHFGETPMNGEGVVYVYAEPASGGWVNADQTAELSGYDIGEAGDGLGASVAISGSTIVAGAPVEPWSGDADGAVYVWTEPASGHWVSAPATAKLTSSDAAVDADDELGASVAVYGSTIVAGAPFKNSDSGAVYVWTLPPGGVWTDATQTARLTASDANQDDLLGASVAVSGPTIFAGAAGKGAMYEWDLPSYGVWTDATQSTEVTPGDGATTSFGRSMALSGDTLVVGSRGSSAHVYTDRCAQDPSETDGGWEFGGCFANPDPSDYDTTQSSSLDGMPVTPSDSTDEVDYSTGGSGGDTLSSSESTTSLSLDLSSISNSAIGKLVLTKALQKLQLSGGPVTIPVPSGFKLAGLPLTGSITFQPQQGGVAVGTVMGNLPAVLGGGPAKFTITTKFGVGVTSMIATAKSGPGTSLANVFGLSSLKLTYSPSGWSVYATAQGAGGTTQTLNGSVSFNSAGSPTAGQLTINNVVIAGLLQVETFKVSYSSANGWAGAADLAQGSQKASVDFAFTSQGVMTSGSITASGITLWQVFELKKFAMTYKQQGNTWGLALSVAGKPGAPAVDASLTVSNGTVLGAALDFKNVTLLEKITVKDLSLQYTHTAAGHDDFSGSTHITLPGAYVSDVKGTFAMQDGLLTEASLDLYGNVPLYGALTLNHLGAKIQLSPSKVIEGHIGLSAGPRIDDKELLGLDDGVISYEFPADSSSSGVYTFSGTLAALGKTLGQGKIVVDNGLATVDVRLGDNGKGLSVGKYVSVTGEIKGGLHGHNFAARGSAAVDVKVGTHSFSASGVAVASNTGITACASIPKISSGRTGATYEWDGTVVFYKDKCPY